MLIARHHVRAHARVCVAMLAALFAVTTLNAAPRKAGGLEPTLDKGAFEFSAHKSLEGKVMGYSFLLMKNGQLVSESSGGNARNAADGHKAMTTRTPQNMGSLFKFITGVTMLHILERPPAGSVGGKNSFDARLNAPTALLYPQIWQSAIKTPQISTLTFRHLLQHKSGFRGCSEAMKCFGSTFDPTLISKRDYENINFSLTGYLIGIYTKPGLLQTANRAPTNVSVGDRNDDFELTAGQQMDTFMRTKVFPKVPGDISASCDAKNEYSKTGAYHYISKDDKGKGIITSRVESGKPCVGSGGYWMSIRDFSAFVATALHSDILLSANTRALMYREPMDPDDRLVWSFTLTDSWIKNKFGMNTIIYSGGDQPYAGGQGAHTAVVRLPQNYEVLVFTNSDELSSSSLAKIGVAAFRAGMERNF
jgi:CubicO group peptidase (beta-lactamase class C family)